MGAASRSGAPGDLRDPSSQGQEANAKVSMPLLTMQAAPFPGTPVSAPSPSLSSSHILRVLCFIHAVQGKEPGALAGRLQGECGELGPQPAGRHPTRQRHPSAHAGGSTLNATAAGARCGGAHHQSWPGKALAPFSLRADANGNTMPRRKHCIALLLRGRAVCRQCPGC